MRSLLNKETRPGHSTGPTSENGKENSSRNAATHGLSCKKCFLIPGETEEQYLAHAQSWIDEYKQYSSAAFQSLLQDLIEAHWLQKRAMQRAFESESALANAEANRDPAVDEIFRRLRNIQRYKTSYETSFQRALRAVQAFCKTYAAAEISHVRCEQAGNSLESAKLRVIERIAKICNATEEWTRGAVDYIFDLKPIKPALSEKIPEQNRPPSEPRL